MTATRKFKSLGDQNLRNYIVEEMLNKLDHFRNMFVTCTKHVLTNEDNVESHTSISKDECVICWEQLSILEDTNIWQSPRCLHLFHKKCLIPWQGENSLKSTLVKAICPLCRIYDDPIFIGKEEFNTLENFAGMKKERNHHNVIDHPHISSQKRLC